MLRMLLALIGGSVALAGAAEARPDATARAQPKLKPRPVTATTFVFSGRGWGHGVGLCQVGAYGMALRGHDYREILAHYYQGARLGTLPASAGTATAAARAEAAALVGR